MNNLEKKTQDLERKQTKEEKDLEATRAKFKIIVEMQDRKFRELMSTVKLLADSLEEVRSIEL